MRRVEGAAGHGDRDDGSGRESRRFDVLISTEPRYPITAKSILVLYFLACLSPRY